MSDLDIINRSMFVLKDFLDGLDTAPMSATQYQSHRSRIQDVNDALKAVDRVEQRLSRVTTVAAREFEYVEPEGCQCAASLHPPCSFCENNHGEEEAQP